MTPEYALVLQTDTMITRASRRGGQHRTTTERMRKERLHLQQPLCHDVVRRIDSVFVLFESLTGFFQESVCLH
jgi:hypothetical protein